MKKVSSFFTLMICSCICVLAQNNSISGVVFLDENKDGIYNEGEQKLEGVSVSNQKDIVQTNKEGRYTIDLRDGAFLYVLKPSGYQVSLNAQKFQQNYYFHHTKGSPKHLKYPGVSATGDVPKQINFPLYKVKEEKPFKALVIGDPQAADKERIDFFRDGGVTDMLRQKADFYIVLGDIADDYLDIYPREKAIISMLNIPGYHVVGNHDINYKSNDEVNHFETFRKEFGPDYYAFNYGKTHFVVLNNINYFGWNAEEDKRGSYFGGLDEAQLEWLKKDLSLVPEDYLIVLNTHIPFLEDFTEATILEDLKSLLKNRKSLLLSGHTHAVKTYWDHNELSEGVIAGASCGSWWTGPYDEEGIPVATSMDGAPKGYFVFEFSGANYTYEFIPEKHPQDYQIRINLTSKEDTKYIVANWFIGKPHEEVMISIDNEEPIIMENYTGFDPFMELTLKDRKNKDDWSPGLSETNHLWKIPVPKDISKGMHKIEVTAETDSGKIYKGYKIFEI
ncbi:calcineurin-like phosphoesterase family protein [uncultured Algibacter sp.]|uniref:calcineurin-like phosphoesterase family protein n=1 Tax=uncultured Algibacter sp. TaxID=298659 RepID=UPI00261F164C|nr:calcineurin-like phosphoesterase family protein [uncultured Algibacter sp.]